MIHTHLHPAQLTPAAALIRALPFLLMPHGCRQHEHARHAQRLQSRGQQGQAPHAAEVSTGDCGAGHVPHSQEEEGDVVGDHVGQGGECLEDGERGALGAAGAEGQVPMSYRWMSAVGCQVCWLVGRLVDVLCGWVVGWSLCNVCV